ncbi:hypothetical protein HDU76_003675 [Blyttiomyces sp. JEL0837]|nr:hypothetical protein HDU76_003675 [Blyttiomyces sp. JEL0837]
MVMVGMISYIGVVGLVVEMVSGVGLWEVMAGTVGPIHLQCPPTPKSTTNLTSSTCIFKLPPSWWYSSLRVLESGERDEVWYYDGDNIASSGNGVTLPPVREVSQFVKEVGVLTVGLTGLKRIPAKKKGKKDEKEKEKEHVAWWRNIEAGDGFDNGLVMEFWLTKGEQIQFFFDTNPNASLAQNISFSMHVFRPSSPSAGIDSVNLNEAIGFSGRGTILYPFSTTAKSSDYDSSMDKDINGPSLYENAGVKISELEDVQIVERDNAAVVKDKVVVDDGSIADNPKLVSHPIDAVIVEDKKEKEVKKDDVTDVDGVERERYVFYFVVRGMGIIEIREAKATFELKIEASGHKMVYHPDDISYRCAVPWTNNDLTKSVIIDQSGHTHKHTALTNPDSMSIKPNKPTTMSIAHRVRDFKATCHLSSPSVSVFSMLMSMFTWSPTPNSYLLLSQRPRGTKGLSRTETIQFDYRRGKDTVPADVIRDINKGVVVVNLVEGAVAGLLGRRDDGVMDKEGKGNPTGVKGVDAVSGNGTNVVGGEKDGKKVDEGDEKEVVKKKVKRKKKAKTTVKTKPAPKTRTVLRMRKFDKDGTATAHSEMDNVHFEDNDNIRNQWVTSMLFRGRENELTFRQRREFGLEFGDGGVTVGGVEEDWRDEWSRLAWWYGNGEFGDGDRGAVMSDAKADLNGKKVMYEPGAWCVVYFEPRIFGYAAAYWAMAVAVSAAWLSAVTTWGVGAWLYDWVSEVVRGEGRDC